LSGFRALRQQAIPVVYEAVHIDTGFRADLVVEDKAIVEIKAISASPIYVVARSSTAMWSSSRTALRASPMDSTTTIAQSR
jgi:GxxExxY protein